MVRFTGLARFDKPLASLFAPSSTLDLITKYEANIKYYAKIYQK
jgi:hypothetical protein